MKLRRSSIIYIFLLHVILLGSSHNLKGQQIDLQGKIIDAETSIPLIGVHIIPNHSKGTVSDIDGNFHIKLQFGDTIKFTLLGYDSLLVYMNDFTGMQDRIFTMQQGYIKLQDVGITGQYQANTILKNEELEKIKVNGIKYSDKPHNPYRLGVKKSASSPITAISRVVSRSYKQEKKFVKQLKVRKEEDRDFVKASAKLDEVLLMSSVYLDDYYYRDFMYFTGLSAKGILIRSIYELIEIVPKAVEKYNKHLAEQEKEEATDEEAK